MNNPYRHPISTPVPELQGQVSIASKSPPSCAPGEVEAMSRVIFPDWWKWFDVHGDLSLSDDAPKQKWRLEAAERAIAHAKSAALSPQELDAKEGGVEALAQFLHDEGGFGDAMPDRTWPEHPDDTGQREGGWVKIVPSDVQAHFRDVARRWLMPRATPSQRLDAATVERCAIETRLAEVRKERDSFSPRATESDVYATRRDILDEVVDELEGLLSALATEPHQHGAGNGGEA